MPDGRFTAPDGGVTVYHYDAEGNLDYVQDPRNLRTGGTDLDAVGLLSNAPSGQGRVWVGINRLSSNGGLLIFPRSEPFRLQCADMKPLSKEHEVIKEVRSYLEQHCQN